MKRTVSFMIFLVLLGGFSFAAHAEPVGKFSKVEGRVDITRSGAPAILVYKGDEVNVGDIIRTKSKSKAEIVFIDGSILRIAQESRLKIDEYMVEGNNKSGIFNLFRGKIENVVKKSGGIFGFKEKNKYEVHTPTAVCGVKGTDFFSFHQSGMTNFIFKEGQGYGYNKNMPDQVATINTGQAMIIINPNVPPVIRTAPASEIDRHSEDTAVKEKGHRDEEKGGDKRVDERPGDKKRDDKAKDQKPGDYKPGDGDRGDDKHGDRDKGDRRQRHYARAGDKPGDDRRGDDGPGDHGPRGDRRGDSGPRDGRPGDHGPGAYGPRNYMPGGPPSGDYKAGDYGPAGPPPPGAYSAWGPPPPGDYGAWGPPPPGDYGAWGPPPPGDYGALGPPPPGDYGAWGPPPPGDYSALGPPPPGDYSVWGPPPPGDYGALGPPPPGDYSVWGPPPPGDYSVWGPPPPGDYSTSGPLLPADYWGASPDIAYDIYNYIPGTSGTPEIPGFRVDNINISGNSGTSKYDLSMSGVYNWTPPFVYIYEDIKGQLAGNLKTGYFLGSTACGWNKYGQGVSGIASFFYIDSGDRTGGLLMGGVSGSYSPSLNNWNASGSLDWVQLGSGLSVPTSVAGITDYARNTLFVSGRGDFYDVGDNDIGDITITGASGIFDSIAETQYWGYWRTKVEGSYSGNKDNFNDWFCQFEQKGLVELSGTENLRLYMSGDGATSSYYSYGEFKGDVAGGWVDIEHAVTGIAVGELHGGYDPNGASTALFAASGGVWLDTSILMAKLGTPAGLADLAKLGIPNIEIGKATLSGSSPAGANQISVTMTNVTFLANASGATPRIWATDAVSGTYTGTPSTAWTVNLAQTAGTNATGVNADFNLRTWDTSSKKWDATVSNGVGTVGGTAITFKGGAAGNIDNPAAGQLSGTAAGWAKKN